VSSQVKIKKLNDKEINKMDTLLMSISRALEFGPLLSFHFP